MKKNQQKGVSLIITFLIVVVLLTIVLGMAIFFLSQVNIIANTGNSLSAFFAADTGVEKTLYLNKISPQTGSVAIAAGFCGICSSCAGASNDCQNCAYTPLVPNGCNASCDNCKVTYTTVIDQRTIAVEATVTPNSPNPIFFINATGVFNNIERTTFYDSSKYQ